MKKLIILITMTVLFTGCGKEVKNNVTEKQKASIPQAEVVETPDEQEETQTAPEPKEEEYTEECDDINVPCMGSNYPNYVDEVYDDQIEHD